MKLALISDIHEDFQQLKKAFTKIEKQNCDGIVCLGDISGFTVPYSSHLESRNASLCLEIIAQNCFRIILGNHDLHAIRKTSNYNPQFQYPPNWYELDFHERKKISKNRVWLYDHQELDPLYRKDQIEQLKQLPEIDTLNTDHKKLLFTHYLYPNISGSMQEFIHSAHNFKPHFSFMQEQNTHISFIGHTHLGGLHLASEDKFIQIPYGKAVQAKNKTIVFVPPITGNRKENGFVIYDSMQKTLEAISLYGKREKWSFKS